MSTQPGAGFSERTAWARNVAAPIRSFLSTESGSAMVLLAATVAAMVWANSPWADSYESVWETQLSIQLGGDGISLDLRHWINEGLMTLFFLVVGLEAKRELDLGALRDRQRLAIPALAALGGMGLAVLIYLLFNAGGEGANGWAAAMSTDTAFALGVLALVARGAERLRVRILTLVIIDDLVALLIIATVYSENVELLPLALAVALFAALIALRYAPAEWRAPAAVILGAAVWVALFESGVDPVIAGLAVGLVTSAYPPPRSELERVTELTRSFREQPTPRAGALGPARGDLGGLAERAPPVPAPPLDQLRDRAPVRARERGHRRRRGPAPRRAHVSDHARDRLRVRRGQARGSDRGRLACDPAAPRRPAAIAELARDRRGRGGGRHRLHGRAPDLEPRIRRAAARGGEARRARRGDPLVAPQLGRVPGDRQAARLGPRPPARRHGGRAARPLRGRQARARPHPRLRPGAGDPRGVRRLPVPVLRARGGGDPRAARRRSETTSATCGATFR